MSQYKINFPHYGTVTLLSMWQKGKGKKAPRFLVEDEDGEQLFLWLGDHHFQGKALEAADEKYCKTKSPTHVKNGCYNYYLEKADCTTEFEAMLDEYVNSNPLVAEKQTGGPCLHTEYNRVNYKLWEKV